MNIIIWLRLAQNFVFKKYKLNGEYKIEKN